MQKKLSLLILLIAGFLTDANAQPPAYIPLSIPITISEVLDLNVSPSTTLNFNFTSTDDIDNGLIHLPPHKLTYKSNKAFYITIKGIGISNTTSFSGGIEGARMPISSLKYSFSSSGPWTSLTDTPQDLFGSASTKRARGNGDIFVYFKMDPGYVSHPAQDYIVTVSYNIANQ